MQKNWLSSSPSNEQMLEMALALAQMRDAWVKLSLDLKDMLTEGDTPHRDEVMTEVERYLVRLREFER